MFVAANGESEYKNIGVIRYSLYFISICEHCVCASVLRSESCSLQEVEATFSVIRQFRSYVCVVWC